VLILQAATNRIFYKNTVFMIHQSHSLENMPDNNYQEISKEFSRKNETFLDLISDCAGKKYQSMIEKNTIDLYLKAEKMLEFGLLHKVI
jgi:ATP-dependent protease ClpP protease subunit